MVEMNSRRRVGDKRARRKAICLALIAIPVLLFSIAGSIFVVLAYQRYSASYRQDVGMAQEAVGHIRTAESLLLALQKNPFDAQAVEQAGEQFASAKTSFSQLDERLGEVPAIATLAPVYGTRIYAALHLVPLAIDVSDAGITGCAMLQTLIAAFHNPLQAQGNGLTQADLDAIEQDVRQIEVSLNLAIGEARQVTPADVSFEPGLARMLALFQNNIPAIQAWMGEIEQFLRVAPVVLGIGTPANYLVEVLDSTELRPGGGFIGNYGIATFSGGRLVAVHITDVDLLDKPFAYHGGRIRYPAAYAWFSHFLAPQSWSLRDSNLDADFPTSARNGEANYRREGGNVAVKGVIAITPLLIERVLEITGPVAVPEYNEVVTAQNLIDKIHYYQLGPGTRGVDWAPAPGGHSSERKQFTELLAEHVFARVRQLPQAELSKFLQVAVTSIHTKDIQVYFNESAAEQLLHSLRLDGAIQAPQGDSLFVVDANVHANKANRFITTTLDDQITIDAEGNALHHLVLHYAWLMPGEIYGSQVYIDYVRVYVPPGSILYSVDGWNAWGTTQAFGRKVWAGSFSLTFGQTHTISLTWMVHKAAQEDGSGCHYRELLQKQAGTAWSVNESISLLFPDSIASLVGGLVASGHQSARFKQALSQDTSLEVDYACQG